MILYTLQKKTILWFKLIPVRLTFCETSDKRWGTSQINHFKVSHNCYEITEHYINEHIEKCTI